MIYRDYCWNTKRGIIESIKILKFTENKEFVLSFTKKDEIGSGSFGVAYRGLLRWINSNDKNAIINSLFLNIQNGGLNSINDTFNDTSRDLTSKAVENKFELEIKLKMQNKTQIEKEKLKIENSIKEIVLMIKNISRKKMMK
jgi:hypothetical protein